MSKFQKPQVIKPWMENYIQQKAKGMEKHEILTFWDFHGIFYTLTFLLDAIFHPWINNLRFLKLGHVHMSQISLWWLVPTI
jgi:hypothetical protein